MRRHWWERIARSWTAYRHARSMGGFLRRRRKDRVAWEERTVEHLEERVLLTFADLFDVTVLAPTSVSLDNPFDGVWNGDRFEIIGAEANQAALERFDISGSAEPIVLFDSLDSAAGEMGDATGQLRDSADTPNGRLYVGQSAGLVGGIVEPATPTYWRIPNMPLGGVGPVGVADAGTFVAVSSDCVFVGTDQDAIFGVAGSNPELLPGGGGADSAVSISSDSQHIVGSFIWIANELGGYDVVDTSGFDFFGSGGGAPTWLGVEVDASGDAFYAGQYFDTNTFENAIGFWQEDGSFLGSVGQAFADFAVVDRVLVAAVNDGADGKLVRMSDLATVTVSSLTGSAATFPNRGLFANGDQLGLLLEGDSGPFVTVVSGDPLPAQVALPAAGSYEILRDANDLIAQVAGGSEIFRRNASSVSVLTIIGTSGVDVVTVLNSGTAVDTPILFDGAAGDDQFDGSLTSGVTTLIGSRGSDTLLGGTGDDIILAGSGGDSVSGGAGNDLVLGQSGNDTIFGDNGNDTVRGGRGRDTLSGGQDSDVLIGGGDRDQLSGGDGADRLIGGPGRDQLDGDAGDDVLTGGAGPDDIAGGLGADTLNGVFRDDTFNQTVGRDTLIGGLRPAARPAPLSNQSTLVDSNTDLTKPVIPKFTTPPQAPNNASETDNAFADPLLPDLLEL